MRKLVTGLAFGLTAATLSYGFESGQQAGFDSVAPLEMPLALLTPILLVGCLNPHTLKHEKSSPEGLLFSWLEIIDAIRTNLITLAN